jgi:hypothetical protein
MRGVFWLPLGKAIGPESMLNANKLDLHEHYLYFTIESWPYVENDIPPRNFPPSRHVSYLGPVPNANLMNVA